MNSIYGLNPSASEFFEDQLEQAPLPPTSESDSELKWAPLPPSDTESDSEESSGDEKTFAYSKGFQRSLLDAYKVRKSSPPNYSSETEENLGSLNLLGKDVITRELSRYFGATDWFGGLGLTCKAFYALTRDPFAVKQIAHNLRMKLTSNVEPLDTIKELFLEYIKKPLTHSWLEVKPPLPSMAFRVFKKFIKESCRSQYEKSESSGLLLPPPNPELITEIELRHKLLRAKAPLFETWVQEPENKLCIEKINALKIRFGLPDTPLLGSLFKSLTSLSLELCYQAFLPSYFSNLNKLVKLNLDHNNFTAIPDQVMEIPTLEELSMKGNKLTEISPKISKLEKLWKLNLSHNQISSIPSSFDVTFLQVLDLSENQLTTLPDTFKHLIFLKSLYLNNNSFRDFPRVLYNFEFQFLDFRGNPLSKYPEFHMMKTPFLRVKV